MFCLPCLDRRHQTEFSLSCSKLPSGDLSVKEDSFQTLKVPLVKSDNKTLHWLDWFLVDNAIPVLPGKTVLKANKIAFF